MVPLPRRTLAALLVLSAALCGSALPASAAPGSTGDLLSVGRTLQYASGVTGLFTPSATGTFDVTTGAPGLDSITVSATGYSSSAAKLTVTAPLDRPTLEVGSYTAGGAAATAQDAGLALTTANASCPGGGTIDVLDVTHDADGLLTGIALDYEITCTRGSSLQGTLRWNSDEPYRLTLVRQPPYLRERPGVPAPATVTLANAGSVEQTYGTSTLDTGQAGGTAEITQDGCAGVTLAPGASCTVDVSVVSNGSDNYSGLVRTPDQSPSGEAVALVRLLPVLDDAPVVSARPGRASVTLSTDEQGGTYRVWRWVRDSDQTQVADAVAFPWTDTDVVPGTTYSYSVARLTGGLETSVGSASVTARPLAVADGAAGEYVAVDPVRVADTRDGTGVRKGAVGPGETITFDPAATGDVPGSGVTAVLLNVTGTAPTAATSVRVWAAGTPIPGTSSLNLAPGQTRPNQVVVPVGADGRIALNNGQGSTHLLVDVQGFYSTADGEEGGGYHPQDPARVLDTRHGSGAFAPSEERWVPLTGVPDDATAVDVNLTVTEPTREGHLVAWSGDGAAPGASHANFVAGQTVPNHAVVPVAYDEDGAPGIAIRNNSAGRTHVLVDVQGWYDDGGRPDGLRFAPTTPTRIADTRTTDRPLGDGRSVPGDDVTLPSGVAHVVNVTAVSTYYAGHLVAWSGEGTQPTTSTVNFVGGETAANLATVRASSRNRIAVTAVTGAPVHVVVDHVGVFY
ncbi:hypothetical protein [Cellulomonas cellasea]|uniref:Fibronectin type-III domain-containing protein n=1 Tax=Cellulomonas cellasea TaxID=43670 RepID=A0A7W4YC01_9CELL|nr:hypothetical protein [Cellulomonas cellasea]MBB2923604.1 hypothetical protein [Cellulomonas cellasea]